MTLDGKIASRSGDSKISDPEDLQRVHELRSAVDAIMIGIGTVLIDNPRLTTRMVDGHNPIRVVVDGRAETPLQARVLGEKSDLKPIVAVTERACPNRVISLKRRGAEIITAGKEDRVDLTLLMERLWKRGIRTIMLEGGGTLNWSMLNEGLVDEVRVAVAPILIGGRDAVTLVEGDGVSTIAEGIHLKLSRIQEHGQDLVLVYTVANVQEGL